MKYFVNVQSGSVLLSRSCLIASSNFEIILLNELSIRCLIRDTTLVQASVLRSLRKGSWKSMHLKWRRKCDCHLLKIMHYCHIKSWPGLSPAGAEGGEPKENGKTRFRPKIFKPHLYIVYELLNSAPKPSPRGQILETALVMTALEVQYELLFFVQFSYRH